MWCLWLGGMLPDDFLCFPSHYPPTSGWKKFFLGVRGLGPDLSFFQQLLDLQAARTSDSMQVWDDAHRRAMAARLGVLFAKHLNWLSPYFLPQDRVAVIGTGPRFGALDNDQNIELAVKAIEKALGIQMPLSFWVDAGNLSMSELVDQLLMAEKMQPQPNF